RSHRRFLPVERRSSAPQPPNCRGRQDARCPLEARSSVNRVSRSRIPHIRLRSHQQQRTHPLECLQIVERVKRRRLVILRRRRVVRNLRILHVFESVLLQQFDVLCRRAHLHRHLQLWHPLQRVRII